MENIEERKGFFKAMEKLFICPQRVIMAIFAFLGIALAYSFRISFAMALTQMVIKPQQGQKNVSDVCEASPELVSKPDVERGNWEWSQSMQGNLLGFFFLGYLVMHLPAALLAERFGAKWVYGLGNLVSAVLHAACVPAVNMGGPWALIAVRLVMGFSQGVLYPGLSVLIAHWVPKSERGKIAVFIYSGAQVGSIMGTALSGLILSKLGWPSVYYIFGGAGVIWFIFYVCLVYNGPDDHPFIKQGERDYLLGELGLFKRKELPPTPWKAIFTNKPFLWSVVAQSGHDYGLFVIINTLPKYFNDVMRFNIQETGHYSSFVYYAQFFGTILSGFLADWVINSGKMGITVQRKVFSFIGALLPAVFIQVASYAECTMDKMLTVYMFVCAMFTMGPYYGGLKLAPNDLAPNYAGTLMAISNGIGSLAGYGAPSIVGLLTPNGTLTEWNHAYWVNFAILVGLHIPFCIWGAGEVQESINSPPPKE